MADSKIEIKGVKGGGRVSVYGRDRIKVTGALANYWQRKSFTERDRSELSRQSQSINIEDIEGVVEVVGRDDIALEANEVETALSYLQTVLASSEKLDEAQWRQLSEQMRVLQDYAQDQKPSLKDRAGQAIQIIKGLITVAQLAGPYLPKAIEILSGVAAQLGLPLPS